MTATQLNGPLGTAQGDAPPLEHEGGGYERASTLTNPYGLPGPLGTKQLLYLWLPQGILAAFLDGGINFGIATAMYRNANSVTMWILAENTVAGDMAVTTFIQGVLTFVIVNTMVNADVRAGTIDAFPVVWPSAIATSRSNSFKDRLGRTFGGDAGLNFKLSRRDFFKRLGSTLMKGLLMSAILFLLVWPIAILCVAPYWSTRNMRNTWTPMVIKFVYAFFLGLIQNHLCAFIAMGSPGAVTVRSDFSTTKLLQDLEKRNGETNTMAERVNRNSIASAGFGLRESIDLRNVVGRKSVGAKESVGVRDSFDVRDSIDGSYSTDDSVASLARPEETHRRRSSSLSRAASRSIARQL